MYSAIIVPLGFSVLNRARGSQFWNLLSSTSTSRVIATLGMALVTASTEWGDDLMMAEVFLWSWATLMLWCVFAWDNYWSAAIGNPTDINKPACKPVDWIMSLLPSMPLRLWGAVAMGLRQTFAVPCIVGLALLTHHPEQAIYAFGTILFGLIYLVAGYVWPKAPINVAEPLVGSAIGFIIYNAVA